MKLPDITGWRKILIVLIAFALAIWRPLNEHQANVLIYIGIAAIAGNSVEHLKEAIGGISDALIKRNSAAQKED